MMIDCGTVFLRKPELDDIDDLYKQKNDLEVTSLLGGFSKGLSKKQIGLWIESHNNNDDEVLLVICDKESGKCIGHAGLYDIDHRSRAAEYGIVIGNREFWGRGVGKLVSNKFLEYGFSMLNLNRIQLSVLVKNSRAIHLYELLGFQKEGVLREAVYKDWKYQDVLLMSLLKNEFVVDNA